MTFLHPGDLSPGDWLRMLGLLLLFCVAPVFIVGLIIYKVISSHGKN